MTKKDLSSRSDQSCHSAACEVANMGFRVFPYYPLAGTQCSCPGECHSPGKHPRICRYLDLATRELQQIDVWWKRWPDAGIGICPDNQLILDIDGPSGHANLLEMQRSLGAELPPTFTCISGSREPHHYHLYFKLPSGTRLLNKPLHRFAELEAYQDIDVRSQRGQVAAPGTPHRDGLRYHWDCGGTYRSLGKPSRVADIPEAPVWLLAALGGVMVHESSLSTRVRRKPCEMPSRVIGGMSLEPGSNAWFLRTICERWPITQKGQRNCLQGKPVTYLVAKRVPTKRVREIMVDWLSGYSEIFESSMANAIRELYDCIDRTQGNLDCGRIESITDHSAQASAQELHPVLVRFLESTPEFGSPFDLAGGKHSNDLSVPSSIEEPESFLSERSLLFVRAVMLHYQYRATEFGETDTIRLTHSQLQEILKNRFGHTVHRRHLYKLADQFISRKDQHGKEKRASVFELLKQTKRGYTGKPSEYRVTGLPSLA